MKVKRTATAGVLGPEVPVPTESPPPQVNEDTQKTNLEVTQASEVQTDKLTELNPVDEAE